MLVMLAARLAKPTEPQACYWSTLGGSDDMNDRQRAQRQHEDYWGRCWTVPLGVYLGAGVRSSRPDNDAHDIEFRIQRSDGTVATSWGEVTGTYYDNPEARWLWDPSPAENEPGLYVDPDARTGIAVQDRVAHKRGKCRDSGRAGSASDSTIPPRRRGASSGWRTGAPGASACPTMLRA